jgi:hypothetical protein
MYVWCWQVSFDEPAMLQSRPTRDKMDFWKNTKQLEHGSLIALWHEPNAPANSAQMAARVARLGAAAAGGSNVLAVNPHIIFATVVDRDARKLAGIPVAGSSSGGSSREGGGMSRSSTDGVRCCLGIRWVRLLAACLSVLCVHAVCRSEPCWCRDNLTHLPGCHHKQTK